MHLPRTLALLALAIPLTGGCSSHDSASSTPTTQAPATASHEARGRRPDMDVRAFKPVVDGGSARILDVRTSGEFRSGHVAGAKLVPVQELGDRMGELADWREQEVYVICAVGSRSSAATDMLAREGFKSVTNIAGGTRAWMQAGFPVEK